MPDPEPRPEDLENPARLRRLAEKAYDAIYGDPSRHL